MGAADVGTDLRRPGGEARFGEPCGKIGIELTRQNKTGKGMVLGFSPRGEPIVYSFTHRNLTPAASRRGVDTVSAPVHGLIAAGWAVEQRRLVHI